MKTLSQTLQVSNVIFLFVTSVAGDNKGDIDKIAKYLDEGGKKSLKGNLVTLFDEHNSGITKNTKLIKETLKYIDQSVKTLRKYFDKEIDGYEKKMLKSLNHLNDNTKDKMEKLFEKKMEEMNKVDLKSQEDREKMVKWLDARQKLSHIHSVFVVVRWLFLFGYEVRSSLLSGAIKLNSSFSPNCQFVFMTTDIMAKAK